MKPYDVTIMTCMKFSHHYDIYCKEIDFVVQIWCESGKIPTFLGHFFGIINNVVARYDVTEVVCVA